MPFRDAPNGGANTGEQFLMRVSGSLPAEILARSFQASNGELGILPADTDRYLAACEADGVAVLGWELWIIDHRMGITSTPIPTIGQWTGGVPTRSKGLAIFGGSGGVEQTRREIRALDLARMVEARWLEYVRFNFTFDGD
jgi:hypothetical protein